MESASTTAPNPRDTTVSFEDGSGLSSRPAMGGNDTVQADDEDDDFWAGKLLTRDDEELFERWSSDLSRDANEKRHRQQQLVHMRRAELITWHPPSDDLTALPRGQGQRPVKLPFFEGDTLTILADEIRSFGGDSTFVRGHLANDPETKVHLSLSRGFPTATIEGPETLYYYESFADNVILREDEPGSQYADFECDCDYHRSL